MSERRWYFSVWQLWSARERKRRQVRFHWLNFALSIYGSGVSLHVVVLGCGVYLATYKQSQRNTQGITD